MHFRKVALLTSRNDLKVAKAGHKSKGRMGRQTDRLSDVRTFAILESLLQLKNIFSNYLISDKIVKNQSEVHFLGFQANLPDFW